jgi:hypothetical protein
MIFMNRMRGMGVIPTQAKGMTLARQLNGQN